MCRDRQSVDRNVRDASGQATDADERATAGREVRGDAGQASLDPEGRRKSPTVGSANDHRSGGADELEERHGTDLRAEVRSQQLRVSARAWLQGCAEASGARTASR